jgi:hypothetical protein
LSGRWFLALSAIVFLLPGCAFPVTQKCDGWLQQEGRRCIDPKTLSFIVPGETTKDDMIRRIGLPTRVFRGGAVYGYDWEMASWFAIAPLSHSVVSNKHHLLRVEFDVRGRVVRYEEKEGYYLPGLEISPESPTSVDNFTQPVPLVE